MIEQTPQEQFDELAAKVSEQIGKTFPIQDRFGTTEVRLANIHVDAKDQDVDDIESQAKARLSGSTWSAPIKADVQVVDTKTGKVLSERSDYTVAKVPKLTRHYTYIVGGKEQSITNQWRLRPGPYVRETQRKGEFDAQFQLSKGPQFRIKQDPSGGFMYIKVGGRKVPAHAVMQAAGVSEDQMQKAWGKDIFEATKKKGSPEKNLVSFYEGWTKKSPGAEVRKDMGAAIQNLFKETEMDPEIAAANLGVRSPHLTGGMLLAATKKMVDVGAGKTKADPIDSLRYKELWTATDHFVNRLSKSDREIETRVRNSLNKKSLREKLRQGDPGVIRDIVMPDLIQKPIFRTFSGTLSSMGEQTNPIDLLSERSKVTIAGEGGITNPQTIKGPAKAVDPSHLGFLDPVFTPEGNPGTVTHLTAGLRIKDKRPVIRMFNVKKGKMEDVDAVRAATSNIVLPDQVSWKDGKPAPRSQSVRMSNNEGELEDGAWRKADYVLPASAQAFSVETNLVPFMQNDSAGRTTMSARHMAQAISITGREAPLVQTSAGKESFEHLVGSKFLAHKSPVAGTVVGIETNDNCQKVKIKGADNKIHEVKLYNHYPLNGQKDELHSTPTVKPGDRVKAGQIVADSNFTKNGDLAIGTNLRTAYLANGLNHEDGIVISESAANKLKSEHLHKPNLYTGGGDLIMGKNNYLRQKEGVYSNEAMKKIDEKGVIRIGATVQPGEPLILAASRSQKAHSVADDVGRRLKKEIRGDVKDESLVWDSPYPGEVVRVNKQGKNYVVHVKTTEPAQVGSKVSTRHSAKGIVTAVLPDSEMPHDAKGSAVDMLLNPVGVAGRMNPGQILETAAGKIAEKTGKPYIVKNFEGGVDYLQKVQNDLKKNGLKDTETLFDPKTGRRLGDIMVGPHYAFQLRHQIDKKTHVRGSGPVMAGTGQEPIYYEGETKIPRRGGHTGAQALGSLGVYSALSAGLHDNLREMQTLKSDQPQAHQAWSAIINGDLLPPPVTPFAYEKFETMLKGVGIDLEKNGTKTKIIPLTDADIKARSSGKLSDPSKTIHGRTGKPERGGLFDPARTGGPDGGKWSHIELVEAIPNPVYAKAIAVTLGLPLTSPEKHLGDVIEGKAKLPNGKTGADAIKAALKGLNLNKEIESTKASLLDPSVKGTDLNRLNLKYKSLMAVQEQGKHPSDVWTIQNVPVMPPKFRPQITLKDGRVQTNPMNKLYRRVGTVNNSLAKLQKEMGGDTMGVDAAERRALYDEVRGLFGTTPKSEKSMGLDFTGKDNPNERLPGLLHMITGDQPKDGFFQDKLIGKRQDYTARATIVADPNLSADEMGLPTKIGVEMMRPMILAKLKQLYPTEDVSKLQTMISQKTPTVKRILEKELENRPLLMKRDPALHQYSLMGQKAKLTENKAITISPLVLPPMGGDIDGDTVALYVPLGADAIQEAKTTLPSQRHLSESTGEVLFTPANEAALSLYRMSIPRGDKTKQFNFKGIQEAEAAFRMNKIDLNNKIRVAGVGDTTMGRLRLGNTVPEQFKKDVLTNLDRPFDRKYQKEVLTHVAKTDPKGFVPAADGMSQLGFRMAYESGHTVALKDLQPLRSQRDTIIRSTESSLAKMTPARRAEVGTQTWLDATQRIHDSYGRHFANNPTDVSDMAVSGIKAKKEQFQGLLMAPMIVEDHRGQPSSVPIKKSFSEGVDLGGYFVQAAGARRGLIQKVEATAQPGYMSKLLMRSNIAQPISGTDCGTTQGVSLGITDRDVVDRYLTQSVTLDGKSFKAGSTVTPEMLELASKGKDKTNQLFVRSPLKCRMPQGVCSRCMGVHPNGKEWSVGENAGVVSAQALGERAAQLMLKQTHGAGIISTSGKSEMDSFRSVNRLLQASPMEMTDAVMAHSGGRLTKAQKLSDGRWEYSIDNKRSIFSRQPPQAGMRVGSTLRRGDQITQGKPIVKDVFKTQGIEAAQNYMVKEIGDIYAKEGVMRRHAELTVRNATGLVRVTDPGGHSGTMVGDYMQKTVVDELNRTKPGVKPIRYKSELKSIRESPGFVERDFVANLQGENLAKGLTRAIQTGGTSDTASLNPIPGIAHGPTFGRVGLRGLRKGFRHGTGT